MPTIEPTSVISRDRPAWAMPKSVTLMRPSSPTQHVVRLDVAVHDAVLVGVAQAGEHLQRSRSAALGGSGPSVVDDLLERPALQVLHGDVRAAVGLAAVVDGDDVRDG